MHRDEQYATALTAVEEEVAAGGGVHKDNPDDMIGSLMVPTLPEEIRVGVGPTSPCDKFMHTPGFLSQSQDFTYQLRQWTIEILRRFIRA